MRRTWEFTSENPIRSVFPLWPVYGLPMLLLRWLWIGNGHDGEITPIIVFWTLRVLMFLISFVLEDWALHELIESSRQRRIAVLLVASSYVTWTYQTHTFSNSVETLVVAWSLVLIQRIVDPRVCRISSPSALREISTDTQFFFTSFLATICPFVMYSSWGCRCLRPLQPHHLSSLPRDPWSAVDTGAIEEVCHCA